MNNQKTHRNPAILIFSDSRGRINDYNNGIGWCGTKKGNSDYSPIIQ